MPTVREPYDEYWFLPLVTGRFQTFVYVVWWPETRVIKAGVTSYAARWRKFCRRGAVLLAVLPTASVETESLIEAELARVGHRAFGSWQEATSHLGAGGCGYTECYQLEYGTLPGILNHVREVEDALVQGG